MKPKTPSVIELTNDNAEALQINIQPFHNDVLTVNHDGVTSRIDVYPTEKATEVQFKDRRNLESIESVVTNDRVAVKWKDMGYGECSKSCAAGLVSEFLFFFKVFLNPI